MIRTKACLSLTAEPLSFAALKLIGSGEVLVAPDEDCMKLVRASRSDFERVISTGVFIYGANTGVGAMKEMILGAEDLAAFNDGLVKAHHFGIGEPFSSEVIRSAIAIRVNTALTGQTGCTAELVTALIALLNADIVPYVRRTGSIGCADIGLMGQIGTVLTGMGEVFYQGKRVPTETAFRLAGLATLRLAPKDSLSSISSNAIAYSGAAHALINAARTLRVLLAVGLASACAMGASRDPLEVAARIGTPSEAAVGSWLFEQAQISNIQPVTRLHDPLSLRMMPQIFGAVIDVFSNAGRAVKLATGSSDDNPVVLDGRVLSSGGSLPLSVSLGMQSASQGIAHAARNCLNRCVLMANGRIRGLPVNLRPNNNVTTGYGPIVKLAADLFSRIVSKVQPVSAQLLVMADGMEDEAAFLPLIIERFDSAVETLLQLAALEALFAAQAMDLMEDKPEGVAGFIHDAVRTHSDFYGEDRPLSGDMDGIFNDFRSERFSELAGPPCANDRI